MMLTNQIPKPLTLEEFLKLPETKPASEYIDGEIEQKPMAQGKHSIIQIRLGTAINEVALLPKLAYAFTELRCTFGRRSIVPDIAVFEWQNIPKDADGSVSNKFEIPPDWIIEILSPEQSTNKIIKKILVCFKHGTKLSWLLDPEDESVTIFYPDRLPEIKEGDDILPVLSVLSNWQLTSLEMFSWLKL
ncbi:hypothetical protein C7H19_00520 [Aphanothece hegewaldii CCALA 016]|uniref:Putative restriction endonuclease domain-containing protein n=1 Tax=Aphanothece hegewaldii CCALA 016 TaxID=2107694 RepID=A0A2T1M3B8_9CHRO|nr:Uma2 family endonuclease [Aphanothece hegewaldii]PSF39306.1 hypothetical protein C7H19_00520 [Aphanothece hegewaldii CCALA 016]